jgi:hypothetical protein
VRRTIQRTCIAHDARSIHTTESDVIYTHSYVHADIPNTNTLHVYLPTFIPVYNAIVRTCPTTTHSYVLHSLECLECRVVGKCCSNVLRSLIAYGVHLKAVHTCVCEKNDTAHVLRSRCTIPYIQPRARSYTPMRTCMPTYQIQTRVHNLHVFLPTFTRVHNTIVHISCTKMPHYYALMRAGYVLHSLECLERGVVGKCCSNVLRSLRAYGVALKAVHT